MEKKLVCVQSHGGKWGAVDKEGNFAVPLKYAGCKVIDDNAYFKQKKKDEDTAIKVNLIDGTQEEYHHKWRCPVPKPVKASVKAPGNSREVGCCHKILKDGKWALWNNGKFLTDYEYDDIDHVIGMSDRFLVKKDGLVGVMNEEGKLLIPINFFEINFFEEPLSNLNWKYVKMWCCYYTEEDKSGIDENDEIEYGHWNKAFNEEGEDITDSLWTPELQQYDEYDMLDGEYSHLFRVRKGDYYGLFDIRKKKEIIPCEYENFVRSSGGTLCGRFEDFHLGIPMPGYLTCYRSGKFGLYDFEGNMLFDCTHGEITHTESGAVVQTDEGVDLYDEHYNLLEKNMETYDECSGYYEGFKTCKKDGVEYIRDKDGNRYLEGKYDIRDLCPDSDGLVETQIENMLDTEHFSHGLMPVCKDYSYGYIDKNFNEVIPLQYSFASNFNDDGYACVKLSDTLTDRNGPWALINTKGDIVVQHEGDQFRYDIDSGLIRVHSRLGQWGIIDTKGNVIVTGEENPLVYSPKKWNKSDDIYCYDPPYADWCVIVKKGQEPIVINSESKEEIGNYLGAAFFVPRYSSYHLYPVTVAGGKWVVVDDKLNIVVPEHYDHICEFCGDRSCVEKGGRYGYIDVDGKLVIPCGYEDAGYFYNEHARVKLNGKWGLIDNEGKVVVPCEYAEIFAEPLKDWGCVFAKKGSKLIKIEL